MDGENVRSEIRIWQKVYRFCLFF